MSLRLRERKGEFWCYDGFVAKRVDVKVCFEIWGGIPFMDRCELWGWEFCDQKHFGDVVLSIVKVIIMNEVLLSANELSWDYVQRW